MSTTPDPVKSALNVFALMDMGMTEAAASRVAKQWEDKCAEVERLRRELSGIAEFCSTDNTRTGALMRLAAIRNTAYQALRLHPEEG